MKIGEALCILSDIIELLKGMGIITSTYDFRAPTNSEDQLIAQRVEAILKNYGVDVPTKVDAVVAMIPLILSLAGVD